MPNFIISPYAISWESIRNQLQAYIQSKTESETWKDFYVSGAGETVVEIAAALGAFYAYHFIVGRRECYLSTAQNYTSIVGLAQNNGYSCARGTNLQINVNYAPSVTTPVYKWDIIGSYLEYDVIAMTDFDGDNELVPGREYNIPVIIGNLVNGSDAIVVPTERLTSFSFHSDTTTDTFRLILNNQEIPVSTEFKDLNKDYWVAITNTFGSVDAFYLQKGNYKYHPNDTLYIQFVERNNLTWTTFDPTNLHIDIPGEITEAGCTLIKDRIEQEDKDQVRLRAPLYHETSMVIRSRKDYSKYLLLANSKLIDANDRDITPGLIEITYLAKDGSIMSEAEIEEWLDNIEEARPSGVARALISHPMEVARNLKVRIWKTETGTTTTLDDEIDEIFNYYNNKLGIELDLNQLEHDIERLDGVKIARVTAEAEKWQVNKNYKIFDVIQNNNGDIFWVSSLKHISGNTKPIWPTQIGDIVVDNQLVWEKVNDYTDVVSHVWEANTFYEKFDYIREEVLTDGTYGQSGKETPVWGRQEVRDNHLIWTKLNQRPEGELKEWASNTAFFLNDYIIIESDETVFYQCTKCYNYVECNIYRVINYTGKSSSESITWGDDIIYDNELVWRKYEEGVIPKQFTSWRKNYSYKIGDNIQIEEYYYTLTNLIGMSNDIEPTWPTYSGGQVRDNNIIWTMMDENARTLSLEWNQYFKLTRVAD